MRALAALVLAACAGRTPAPAAPIHSAPTAPARGAPVPEIAAIDLAGQPVRLAAYRGQRIVVDFWESTCEPCLRALPALAALAARQDRLQVVSITPELPSDPLRAFVAAHQMRWIVASDPTDAVATAFRVAAYPTYFLIDAAGTIACARCSLGEIEGQLVHDQRYSRGDGQR
ncbi:MAG: TlpA disulfide reductase family protein [Kofleriaceae bacterium]